MKQFLSFLVFSLFAVFLSNFARAETVDIQKLLKSVEDARANSVADLSFLAENGHKCSRYFSQIKERVLIPLQQRLSQDPALTRALASFSLPALGAENCVQVTAAQAALSIAAAEAVIRQVASVEAELAARRTLGFRSRSGHEFLVEAFAADSSYPECTMAPGSNDPNSTEVGLRYQKFRTNLTSLRLSAAKLNEQASAVGSDDGGAIACRNPGAVTQLRGQGRRPAITGVAVPADSLVNVRSQATAL